VSKLLEFACERRESNNASRTDIIEPFKAIVHAILYCTVVVDGLDECIWIEEKWKADDDDSLIGFLGSIKQAVAQTTTRVMIVSCDEQDIRSGFQALQADVPTPNLRDDLSHRRVGRCKGMFLWIKMLEDDLSGGKSKRRFGGEGSSRK
jgi:hypothetical protein